MLNTGEIVDNYKIIKYLDSGKAGDVYKAKTIKKEKIPKNKTIAIKIYKPDILKRPNQVDRIKKEANIGLRISGKNLVKIYDYKIDLSKEYGTFLIMEYVKGITLDKWIEKNKIIDIDTVFNFLIQICKGVKFLHNNDIIHRDIKSQNIMITKNNEIKIMDFGVVKPTHQTTVTDSNEFLGTIAYASPEYLFGFDYDKRTDLYSIGCVLYHLLSGKEPFLRNKIFSLQVLAKNRNPPPYKIKKNKANKSIKFKICEELVNKLISKNPDNRPTNCEEIIDLLENLDKSYYWAITHPENYSKTFRNIIEEYKKSIEEKSLGQRFKIVNQTYDNLVIASDSGELFKDTLKKISEVLQVLIHIKKLENNSSLKKKYR